MKPYIVAAIGGVPTILEYQKSDNRYYFYARTASYYNAQVIAEAMNEKEEA